ncbi:putative Multi-sensor signal transduction histidine kinase [Candidatus Sulfotelmatomonas gaucii]|uniref:histidine kinase n=1 Tax=Candidatus Sulfuritelmatomonas gaucii TaxID=2043161 RepID=A0A2N9LYX5_9BACT|nr:putative Multi-sensor signal transduction histidine kinase [Candidatus Sulfotelmatomonas gaucii]
MDFLAIYSRTNRKILLITAVVLTGIIGVVDWYTRPFISIGFLYLFPIMLISGIARRWQIVAASVACAVLQELYSNLPLDNAIPRLVFSWLGFSGTGLFLFELLRNRRMVLAHLGEVEEQSRQLREAEEQLQVLVDSSPAAILTVGPSGEILLVNKAARELFSPDNDHLQGQSIGRFVPALQTALQSGQSYLFRTAIQCRAQRADGKPFLAATWFSTYPAQSGGNKLAAIVVDMSEELVSREDLSLDYLLKNARILMSAVSHEVRNMAGAALVFHQNLSRFEALRENADFEALGTLIHGLEKLSAMELTSGTGEQERQAIELAPVLDELRVLVESVCRDSNIELEWAGTEQSCSVWADHYGLIQVFLNLVKNSRRALESAPEKRIRISPTREHQKVVIRFEDSGPGIGDPQVLFRAFQREAQATGLGLYVSRALMRSFGGDLAFEPSERGCTFVVTLQVA